MPSLLAALCVLALGSAPALTVRHHARSLQPGEVVLLRVDSDTEITALAVRVFGKRFRCYAAAGGRRWECLAGIDLDTAPGPYAATFEADGTETAAVHDLTVEPKAFPTRRLTVEEKFVTPPAETLARIERESKLVREAFSAITPQRLWHGSFLLPVPGEVISAFGKRSILNGQPRSPHGGTDFRGATGTLVHAPNSGRVALADDLYFSGNTVILDHGMGLYSYFAHLSRISVRPGQTVPRGAPLGAVGATGRVTGPHLHWSVRLLDARVDPLSLIYAVKKNNNDE